MFVEGISNSTIFPSYFQGCVEGEFFKLDQNHVEVNIFWVRHQSLDLPMADFFVPKKEDC